MGVGGLLTFRRGVGRLSPVGPVDLINSAKSAVDSLGTRASLGAADIRDLPELGDGNGFILSSLNPADRWCGDDFFMSVAAEDDRDRL